MTKCTYSDAPCSKLAKYGYDKPLFCYEHMDSDMQRLVTYDKCAALECAMIASFSYAKRGSLRYCSKHKLPGMIRRHCKDTCSVPDCKANAFFGDQDSGSIYCAAHKLPGMAVIDIRTCATEKCNNLGYWASSTRSRAYFCIEHKTDDMIPRHHKCAEPDCFTLPSFNFPGLAPAYCNKHKLDGMVDVKNRRCEIEGCSRMATHKNKDGKTYLCFTHRLPIPNGRSLPTSKPKKSCTPFEPCAVPSCQRAAVYGWTASVCTHCSFHKLDGMLPSAQSMCKLPDCTTRAVYGFPFCPLSRCSFHREPKQIKKPARCACGCHPTHAARDLSAFYCPSCVTRISSDPAQISTDPTQISNDLVDFRACCVQCHTRIAFDSPRDPPLICDLCNVTYTTEHDRDPDYQLKRWLVLLLEQSILLNVHSWHRHITESLHNVITAEYSKWTDYYACITGAFGTLNLFLEIDPHQNCASEKTQDLLRMIDIAKRQSKKSGPESTSLFLRVNPDGYKVDGQTIANSRADSDLRRRMLITSAVVDSLATLPFRIPADRHCALVYLFYDEYKSPEVLYL